MLSFLLCLFLIFHFYSPMPCSNRGMNVCRQQVLSCRITWCAPLNVGSAAQFHTERKRREKADHKDSHAVHGPRRKVTEFRPKIYFPMSAQRTVSARECSPFSILHLFAQNVSTQPMARYDLGVTYGICAETMSAWQCKPTSV